MKKYVALATATLLLAAFLLSLPVVLGQLVTSVSVIRPSVQAVSEDIYVSGMVEELSKKDVYVQIPVVPDQVNVEIGDTVEANQLLAKVDTAATRAALFNLVEAANILPSEYISAMGSIAEYADLAGLAGVATLDRNGIDSKRVEEFIPTEILAPASGVVTALSLVPGAISQPQAAVCTISQLDVLRVRMAVEEASAEKVKAGDTVVFKASATGDEKYTGVVSDIFPSASQTLVGTSQQTMVSFYVNILGDTSHLKPGYSANGVVKRESGQTVLTIPYEAVLQDDSNREYVYIYEKARAVRRDIQTGTELVNGVAVTSGLTAADFVITNPADIPGENHLLVLKASS